MSSDMVIICEEDNSDHNGDTSLAFFIDEASMGEPWHEFGRWFMSRFCTAPSMFDQLAGIKDHDFTCVTQTDFFAVRHALKNMECHENLDKKKLIDFVRAHIGKHISTENW